MAIKILVIIIAILFVCDIVLIRCNCHTWKYVDQALNVQLDVLEKWHSGQLSKIELEEKYEDLLTRYDQLSEKYDLMAGEDSYEE